MLCFVLWAITQPAFAGPAFPHHPTRELHKEIETLEMQWRDAQLNNNVAVMDKLLADDYIGISASGTIETSPKPWPSAAPEPSTSPRSI